MPRRATVAPHLPVEELQRRDRHTHDPVERTHWQIVWLVAGGQSIPDIAPLIGYTANWIREIVRRDNADGPAGLADRRQHNRGHPPLLHAVDRDDLRGALGQPPPDGGLWTGRKVAAGMTDRLSRPVGEPRGWEAMRTLGVTAPRPRPRATAADPLAQAAFKKGGSRRRSTR